MDTNLNQQSVLVSIVMPVYNGQTYLREAINSILNQTFKNFEFIIVNDGSNDKSLEIIKSYIDKRIIIIDNEINKGLIYSLNKGIEIAKGAYIARMDSDDISMPNRFTEQVKAFQSKENLIVVSSDYYLLKKNKHSLIKTKYTTDALKAILLFTPCFCHPTVMMKNVFKEKNIFYNKDFIHVEDYKLWTELSFCGNFFNVPIPLLKYRSHLTQISNLNNNKQLQISSTVRKNYLQKLEFNLLDHQFSILNFIGNNEFITQKNTFIKIEDCLIELINQNNKHKKFELVAFNKVIFKFWLDSCGYSNLGLAAFKLFFISKLSNYDNLSLSQKSKFLLKCLIRKFKY